MMRVLVFSTALILLYSAAACAQTGNGSGVLQTAGSPGAREQQQLEPGDRVRVWVWREESLSNEFTVTQEREIVLPRLGAWNVAGKQPDELRAELMEQYARYLREPSIDITFLRRIKVAGAVEKPGLYYAEPTMSAAEVVLLAGGPNRDGRRDRIELERSGMRTTLQLNDPAVMEANALRSGDALFVPERNWASRNTQVVATLASAAVGMATTLLVVALTR